MDSKEKKLSDHVDAVLASREERRQQEMLNRQLMEDVQIRMMVDMRVASSPEFPIDRRECEMNIRELIRRERISDK